jgi:hypothetical protein
MLDDAQGRKESKVTEGKRNTTGGNYKEVGQCKQPSGMHLECSCLLLPLFDQAEDGVRICKKPFPTSSIHQSIQPFNPFNPFQSHLHNPLGKPNIRIALFDRCTCVEVGVESE